MDPKVVDEWVRVSDRDSFLTARRLAREEGLLAGGSSGTTVWAALEIARRLGPEAQILAMLPDSGRSYLSKFFDDKWMLEYGFLERTAPAPTVAELLRAKGAAETDVPALVTISAHQKVGEAIDAMQRYSISQLPVVRDGEVGSLADVIGSLQDRDLLDRVFKNADALHEDVATAMQPPLATIDAASSVDEIVTALDRPHERGAGRERGPPGRRRHALGPARVPRPRPPLRRPHAGALAAAREHGLVGELQALAEHGLRQPPERLRRPDHAQLAVEAALEDPAGAVDVELGGDDVEAAKAALAREPRHDPRLAPGRRGREADDLDGSSRRRTVARSSRCFEPRETISSGA